MVSAGRLHTCGVTIHGVVYCWGRNEWGQLGDGTTEDRAAPVRVPTPAPFATVSAGFGHTCGVARNGGAFCWGGNFNGELGDGTEENRLIPVPVMSGLTFRTISAGEAHTCGVAGTHDQGYCWGAALGLAPDGSRLPNVRVPTLLSLGPLAGISAGYEIACAVRAGGSTYCWGLRPPGVPLPDTAASVPTPRLVPGASPLTSVSAGHKHACGLGADGVAYCWGRNTGGQLGDGTFESRPDLRPVTGGLSLGRLSAHAPTHSCGLTPGGTALCWGQNSLGMLGDGTTTSRPVPEPVGGGLTFASISVGFSHTCGVTTSGTAYCWGYGGMGALGTGTLEDSPTPVPVAPALP
jgi:alpha-tubulin suppressor-like RCC1 family protein